MKKSVKEKLSSFPHAPGVYLFKNKEGKIIYIGKAIDLWKRMRSYIAGRDGRPLTGTLVKSIHDADLLVTGNEKEALVLENNLIKKHKPLYNIDLKDDKNFYNIMIDNNHPYPSIRLVRKVEKRGHVDYFGPYHSSRELKSIIRYMIKVFPIRTCTDSFFKNRKRPCIRYEIKKCSGPCCEKIERKDYLELVSQFSGFLKGKNKSILKKMKGEIKVLSDKLEFEKAGAVFDRLQAIQGMFEKQAAVLHKDVNIDVAAAAVNLKKDALLIQILHIRHGLLVSEETKFFQKSVSHLEDNLDSFFYNYYKGYPFPPDEVLVSEKCRFPLLSEELSRMHGRKISFLKPLRGKKKELLELGLRNAEMKLEEKTSEKKKMESLLGRMEKKLSLSRTPHIMECFDISNIQGTDSVASKVQFKDLQPDTSGYRRYSLHDIKDNDDYLKMAYTIKRRLSRKDLPDLIVIDGGLGHLQVVMKMLDREKKDIPVDFIAIAKDKKSEGEKSDKIFIQDRKNPLVFQTFERDILYKIMQIRDEAHRFAVRYHRLKRKKRLLEK